MKQLLKSTLLLLALLLPATATAHDFEVDGIYYNILNDNEVEVTYKGDFISWDHNNTYFGDVTIPSTVTYNGTIYTVTTIGHAAFYSCTNLTGVTIPNSVTTIGDDALINCSGLTSLTIPNSVITIGDCAFAGCISLISVSIPNSVTTIGENAFESCIDLANVTIGNSVTTIGSGAFYGCSGLVSVTIPNSVINIGGGAFSGTPWYNNQPDGLVYAGLVAYQYKGTMPEGTSITIREGTLGIAAFAFSHCSGLMTVTIPNSVTTIGSSAFYGCSGLVSVTIPNSVTIIGDGAFFGCTGLTSVTIPNSVTDIGSSAFYGCSGLMTVTIPNSVTTIGSYAFYGCSGLVSVTIPNSVAFIGDDAFKDCSGLNDVYSCIADPFSISMGQSVFERSPNNYSWRILHVPYSSFAAYLADTKWSQYFGTIVKMVLVKAESIELDRSDVVMVPEMTLKLKAIVLPEDADNKAITWVSNNQAAATVSNDGLVTAVNVGTATITAMTMDGSSLSAECSITVLAPGDVDADYRISIADVTELIDMLLRGDVSVADNPAADVNGNGIINIADVVELIDQLLY